MNTHNNNKVKTRYRSRFRHATARDSATLPLAIPPHYRSRFRHATARDSIPFHSIPFHSVSFYPLRSSVMIDGIVLGLTTRSIV